MSHTDIAYPQATDRPFTLVANPACGVREDEDPYADSLVRLSDIIDDKLNKAKGLAWVLHGAKDVPEEAVSETSYVIVEFIQEALEAHRKQWGKIRHYAIKEAKSRKVKKP
jgi:hypothetical protein